MKIKFEMQSDYCYLFNYKTGESITIEKEEMFMRPNGPNLLDVSITNRCNKGCDFCYRQSNHCGYDISVTDYKLILSNAKECGVQQIALGGGEPTLHPYFCEILKMTYESGIIPNFSTNGDNLTDEILTCCQKYCGAIALSVYSDLLSYENVIKKITTLNIKLNLHVILRKDRIEEYTKYLKNPPNWLSSVNAIIFLNYKPSNGNDSLCFKYSNQNLIDDFFESIKTFDVCGIGFDTCSVSFVCNKLESDSSLYDFCEAGRKSAYINEKLEVYPCSFYTRGHDSLKTNDLKSIWQVSKAFIDHRNFLQIKNATCKKFNYCHNGCPIYQINFCAECNRICNGI